MRSNSWLAEASLVFLISRGGPVTVEYETTFDLLTVPHLSPSAEHDHTQTARKQLHQPRMKLSRTCTWINKLHFDNLPQTLLLCYTLSKIHTHHTKIPHAPTALIHMTCVTLSRRQPWSGGVKEHKDGELIWENHTGDSLTS